MVVKPSISGGGFRTARYEVHEHERAREHVAELVRSGRTAMVQPYQETVDTEGEVGLIFLGGVFSHAIHKGPHDPPGRRARSTASSTTWSSLRSPRRRPSSSWPGWPSAAAEELLGPTTYARVDTVTSGGGAPAVLELELLDPRMFFVTHPAQAARFAEVIAARLG